MDVFPFSSHIYNTSPQFWAKDMEQIMVTWRNSLDKLMTKHLVYQKYYNPWTFFFWVWSSKTYCKTSFNAPIAMQIALNEQEMKKIWGFEIKGDNVQWKTC